MTTAGTSAKNEQACDGILYSDPAEPGITRRKMRNGWAYYQPDGERITDRDEIDRLNHIGMPPAYSDCWFCPDPAGHLQAVGYDARGRRQYRYHPLFRSAQEMNKYDRCAAFGRALPKLRAKVERDLARSSPTKDTVIAAIVRLLDLGKVRIGNDSYRRQNKSFGATTLLNRHARASRSRVTLNYRGKSGKMQRLTIADRRLARIVKRCHDLPGQTLFQFVDEEGKQHPVTSSDVNAYIKEATGEQFTAKHFRTWGASVIAFGAIVAAGKQGLSLKQMVEPVAQALGNTPAIARKSYIHPAIIEYVRAGNRGGAISLPRTTQYLTRQERGLIAFLEAIDTAAPAKEGAHG